MLSLKIALRYLLSRKSHSAVNVISAISVAGVAVATAAIVVVLSVFNGFTSLAEGQFSHIDPELKVTPTHGKVLAGDSLAQVIATQQYVAAAAPSLQERALAVAGETQLAVVFIGVGPGYERVVDLRGVTDYGEWRDTVYYNDEGMAYSAAPAIGVISRLGARASLFSLYVPRRVGRINPANPAGAFRQAEFIPTAMLRSDRMEFDGDHIVIPIDAARDLLGYDGDEATAVDIALQPGIDADAAAEDLGDLLGTDYVVETRLQQQAAGFRMISIEKWVTFLMLVFILVIATFNIISTLSLLVIEKRDNMATLRFMGAPRGLISRIFMLQSAMITLAGGIAGILVGVALSLAQQWGGFITLSGDPAKMTISVYPVEVSALDILIVMGIIVVIAGATALTTRIFTRKIS